MKLILYDTLLSSAHLMRMNGYQMSHDKVFCNGKWVSVGIIERLELHAIGVNLYFRQFIIELLTYDIGLRSFQLHS